jgi:hypothetical protein
VCLKEMLRVIKDWYKIGGIYIIYSYDKIISKLFNEFCFKCFIKGDKSIQKVDRLSFHFQ